MQPSIKTRIQEIIKDDNLVEDKEDINNLTSLCLYLVYNKPYFKDRFEDFFIMQNVYGQQRIVSPKLNNVSGVTNRLINHFVFSASKESAYDDLDFFYDDGDYIDEYADYENEHNDNEDVGILKKKFENKSYYLKNKQIKNLYNFYNNIKDAESLSDFSNKMKTFAKNNEDALFDFQIIFSDLSNNHKYAIYEWMINNIAVKGDVSKELSHINFRKLGEIKSVDNSYITDDNFKEEFNKFKKGFITELKEVKSVNELIKEKKSLIQPIMAQINKEFPEIKHEPNREDIQDLEFYFVEIPAEDRSTYKTAMTYIPEKETLKNSFLKKPDYNIPFIDFLMHSPYQLNEEAMFRSAAIEGLVYLTESSLHKNEYDKHGFIISKTKQGETVGVLSFHQPKDSQHFSKIGEISVKQNYRNKGLSKKLYENMAKVIIENDIILTNSRYSELGRSYLPSMKKKLQEEMPDLLIIDSHLGDVYENKELNDAVGYFNYDMRRNIQVLEKQGDLDVQKFKKAYKTSLNFMIEESEKEGFTSRNAYHNATELFNKTLSEKPKTKSRLKIK